MTDLFYALASALYSIPLAVGVWKVMGWVR